MRSEKVGTKTKARPSPFFFVLDCVQRKRGCFICGAAISMHFPSLSAVSFLDDSQKGKEGEIRCSRDGRTEEEAVAPSCRRI